jgi:hypothetical protein
VRLVLTSQLKMKYTYTLISPPLFSLVTHEALHSLDKWRKAVATRRGPTASRGLYSSQDYMYAVRFADDNKLHAKDLSVRTPRRTWLTLWLIAKAHPITPMVQDSLLKPCISPVCLQVLGVKQQFEYSEDSSFEISIVGAQYGTHLQSVLKALTWSIVHSEMPVSTQCRYHFRCMNSTESHV